MARNTQTSRRRRPGRNSQQEQQPSTRRPAIETEEVDRQSARTSNERNRVQNDVIDLTKTSQDETTVCGCVQEAGRIDTYYKAIKRRNGGESVEHTPPKATKKTEWYVVGWGSASKQQQSPATIDEFNAFDTRPALFGSQPQAAVQEDSLVDEIAHVEDLLQLLESRAKENELQEAEQARRCADSLLNETPPHSDPLSQPLNELHNSHTSIAKQDATTSPKIIVSSQASGPPANTHVPSVECFNESPAHTATVECQENAHEPVNGPSTTANKSMNVSDEFEDDDDSFWRAATIASQFPATCAVKTPVAEENTSPSSRRSLTQEFANACSESAAVIVSNPQPISSQAKISNQTSPEIEYSVDEFDDDDDDVLTVLQTQRPAAGSAAVPSPPLNSTTVVRTDDEEDFDSSLDEICTKVAVSNLQSQQSQSRPPAAKDDDEEQFDSDDVAIVAATRRPSVNAFINACDDDDSSERFGESSVLERWNSNTTDDVDVFDSDEENFDDE